jgi:hypothetical protein
MAGHSLYARARTKKRERETSSRLNSRMECEEDKPISTVPRQMQSTLTLVKVKDITYLGFAHSGSGKVAETHYETCIAG